VIHLKYVKPHKNVMLSRPKPRPRDEQRKELKNRFLKRLQEGLRLGTRDKAKWTRDQLHERSVP
jgi:hypothetical protein